MSLGKFAGNFIQAFTQGKQQKELREEEKKEKDARLKLFEVQMNRAKREEAEALKQSESRNQFFGKMQGSMDDVIARINDPSLPPMKQRSLVEMLADPEGQMLAMSGGLAKPTDLMPQQQKVPDSIALLQALANDPKLAAVDAERRRAGASQVNVGDQGMTKPPPGMYRPDPSKPGLLPEPGARTPGQEAVDKDFATTYNEFKSTGGYANVIKNLQQLDDAIVLLEEGGLTGPYEGRIPDFAKSLFKPNAIKVQQSIEEAVQTNLRAALGAQFTQKEGEGLMARAFDKTQDDSENALRARRLANSIREAALSKKEAADYFERNGTLSGFKGKLWSLADIESAINGKGNTAAPLPPGIPPGSQLIGTSGGKPVYQTSEGNQLIVE